MEPHHYRNGYDYHASPLKSWSHHVANHSRTYQDQHGWLRNHVKMDERVAWSCGCMWKEGRFLHHTTLGESAMEDDSEYIEALLQGYRVTRDWHLHHTPFWNSASKMMWSSSSFHHTRLDNQIPFFHKDERHYYHCQKYSQSTLQSDLKRKENEDNVFIRMNSTIFIVRNILNPHFSAIWREKKMKTVPKVKKIEGKFIKFH